MDLEEQYDKIYRYCYYRLGNRQSAEDITQETFLRFLESKTYTNTGKTLQYLYTTARNLCIDEYHRHLLQQKYIQESVSEEAEVDCEDTSACFDWIHKRCRRWGCDDSSDGSISAGALSFDGYRLSKQYGSKIAVDRISLRLQKGVYGLLGANGAGKTTLMRLLCGILKPTGGSITLDRMDVSSEEYRARLGYLPQDFGYYPDFTGMDFLLYMAALKGLSRPQAKKKSSELLELVGLQEVSRKRIKTYSGGMKQRLGIAQALLGDPVLLILDEPTAGLDPRERVRFRNLIGELGKENIVLLSTHIVSDIEHIADQILMMKDGQLIWQGIWDETQGDLEEFYLKQFDHPENIADSSMQRNPKEAEVEKHV